MTALSFWPIKRKEVTVSDCLVTVFTMYCHLDKPLWHKALRDFKTFTLLSPDYHVLSPKSLKGGVICRNFKQFDAPGGRQNFPSCVRDLRALASTQKNANSNGGICPVEQIEINSI